MFSAVSDKVRAEGVDWFPELDPRRIKLAVSAPMWRPRCTMYRLTLTDGRSSHAVAVKVRHDDPAVRRTDKWAGQRPDLTTERSISIEERGQREFDALRAIAADFDGVHPERFGVLRALAWMPEHAATVLDWVPEPTLRMVLSSQSRRHFVGASGHPASTVWVNAGRWLRRFHDASSRTVDIRRHPARMAQRTMLLAILEDYVAFLGHTGERDPIVPALARLAARQLVAHVPERVPVALGHGDFTAQNVFVSPSGRVTIFDPMPMWRVPIFVDIGRFTAGIRLFTEQTLSQGLALPRDRLDLCERSFLRGYFGSEGVPTPVVHGFQVMLLLDRWASLISKQRRSGWGRRIAHELRVAAATRHYRSEARRLLSLLDDDRC